MEKYTDQDVVNLAQKIHTQNLLIEELRAHIKMRDIKIMNKERTIGQLKSKIGHMSLQQQEITIDINYEENN
tara:strand:+ start:1141 stop:1356 length:216 start_codon:yes stop_codon:yes gene_type:complete